MILRSPISMATRFNLLNAIVILATALSVGFIISYVQLERQFETLHQHAQAMAKLLAESSEYAVYTRQEHLLSYQLQRLSDIEGLYQASIYADDGRVLAHIGADASRLETPSGQPASEGKKLSFWRWWMDADNAGGIEVEEAIVARDQHAQAVGANEGGATARVLGRVRLSISLDYFADQVRHSYWLGLSAAAVIMLIGLLTSLSMTARITSPLRQLIDAANAIVEGDTRPVHLTSGGAELYELMESFNVMTSWLADYRRTVESYQAMLERQAYFDELTGLANRSLFKTHIQSALSQRSRRQTSIALLFLDLDRFKYVNDTLGHSFGDQLLQQVAQRLRHQVREGDTVARMGGDEFVIVLNDLHLEREQACRGASRVAEEIGKALSHPFSINGHDIGTSFSIGIALCPHDAEDSETLIRNADCAMYEAKTQGRNTYRFYEPTFQQRGFRRLMLENGLKRALERKELILHFQPKFDCQRKRLIGAEALLRWHFEGGWISPAEFIPLAEETGLILPIGEWVIETALGVLAEWRRNGVVDNDFHVGVNVAPQQFWHPEFADRTLAIVNRILPNSPGCLELELTESCLLRPSEDIQQSFATMRNAGLRFAVDDFGTGYSNLSYLKQFPLDVLKIDQSFVRDCIDDPSDATIVRAIIAMAHGLGLETIAEGVESFAHADFLKSEGCYLLQGYLLAKPMPAEQFSRFCQDFSKHIIHSI